MPELPDVEGFRRLAAEHVGHRRVESVRVRDPQVVHPVSGPRFAELVRGRCIAEPQRHGKWLVLPTTATATAREQEPPWLLVHFGMTGMLLWCARGEDRHAHDRVVFRFEHGELRYRDMRKLTGIELARERSELDAVLEALGPDACSVSPAECRYRLGRTRRRIKSALLDQSLVAGLGNLCADEILWSARVHPRRGTTDIDDAAWKRLHRSMRSVLRQSSRLARVPAHASWLTGHRDEPEGRCPRCSAPLCHGRVAGRGTSWCPSCQSD